MSFTRDDKLIVLVGMTNEQFYLCKTCDHTEHVYVYVANKSIQNKKTPSLLVEHIPLDICQCDHSI